jgi:dihydrolipoamide dehydrogenase
MESLMSQYDVCVIGAGPGGYVAAIRCAQLGLKTAVVEKQYIGGVCLNVGCIPSKALISAGHFYHKAQHQAAEMGIKINGSLEVDTKQLQTWKKSVCDKMSMGVKQLLQGNNIDLLIGEAQFQSAQQLVVKGEAGEQVIEAKNTIVATGSRPIEIPGFAFDGKEILSSTEALELENLPKSLIVIGGGYIGLEMSGFLADFGVEVTVVEALPTLLSGVVEKDIVQLLTRKLKKKGIKFVMEAKAQGYEKSSNGLEVKLDVKGKEEKITAEKVLVMVGRKPNGDKLNLSDVGVEVDSRGFVKVDPQRRTTAKNIYAIGDVAGQPMLAHKASHEGVLVAEVIAGQNRVYDVKTVPAVIFTDPEIASAGWTEAQCKENGYDDLKIAKFPFGANGRAVSLMETDGFVKMIADAKTDKILGIHVIGPEASNLISEAALAIEMGANLQDLALTIHPHPTLGETFMEAAEAALGHAIHMIQRPARRK